MEDKAGTCSTIPLCDIHHDDVAQALCKYHKKLLCISCVLEKAKSPECSITEIRKLTGDQDYALYECLLVRQMSMKKKRLIEEHENTIESLKTTLNQQIIELHENLVARLNEMKENCLKTVATQAGAILASNEPIRQEFHTCDKAITETLEKLSTESVDDLSDIRTKMNELKTKIFEEIPIKNTVPEGKFLPSKLLADFSQQSGYSLGTVYLIDLDHYMQIDELKADENKSDKEEKKQPKFPDNKNGNGDGVNANKDSDEPKNPAYTSSDEYHSTTGMKNNQSVTNKGSNDNVDKMQQQDKENECKTGRLSQEVKTEKKRGLFGGLFGKKKLEHSEEQDKDTKTETTKKDTPVIPAKKRTSSEAIYHDTNFATSGHTQPRYLINKTVTIAVQRCFSSACKFSKLVYLESGHLGLLSKAHESVLLTSIDGKATTKKTIPGLTNIVATGKDEIATIVEKGLSLQINRFRIKNNQFSTMDSCIVKEGVSNITGFDFDMTSSKFAISSTEKLVVLQKNGTNVKVTDYAAESTFHPGDVVTTYNFTNDHMYTLNVQNKSLKCFSVAKEESMWKRKYEGQLCAPRNLCLYKDKLCISWSDTIALFSVEDGKPIVKHDTKDLLDDCFGICVVDDVIVFSSNSDEFDTSTKLGFISV